MVAVTPYTLTVCLSLSLMLLLPLSCLEASFVELEEKEVDVKRDAVCRLSKHVCRWNNNFNIIIFPCTISDRQDEYLTTLTPSKCLGTR